VCWDANRAFLIVGKAFIDLGLLNCTTWNVNLVSCAVSLSVTWIIPALNLRKSHEPRAVHEVDPFQGCLVQECGANCKDLPALGGWPQKQQLEQNVIKSNPKE
jgi:hypothetical protein